MLIHIVLYLVLLVGVFVYNIVEITYAPFVLDVLFAVLTFVNIFTVIVLRCGCKVEFDRGELVASVSENGRLSLLIHNASFLPITNGMIKVQVRNYEDKVVFKKNLGFLCGRGRSTTLDTKIRISHPGNYKISIKRLYLYDYMRLFVLGKRVKDTIELIILPDLMTKEAVNRLTMQLSEPVEGAYSDKKIGNDATEIFGFRDYMPGDKMRDIQWKLTAKAGEIIVKEPAAPMFENDTVIIEIIEISKKKHCLDKYYELLYAILYSLLKRGNGFNVAYFDDEYRHMRVESNNDIVTLFSSIYKIEPYENKTVCANYYCALAKERVGRVFYAATVKNERTDEAYSQLMAYGEARLITPKANLSVEEILTQELGI